MTPHWQAELEATVHAFRLGMEGAGNDHLKEFIDRLSGQLNAMSAYQQQEIHNVLAQTLDAQKRNDMIHIADLLEYEIAPLLTRCSSD